VGWQVYTQPIPGQSDNPRRCLCSKIDIVSSCRIIPAFRPGIPQ
jgi:hypothetical protein